MQVKVKDLLKLLNKTAGWKKTKRAVTFIDTFGKTGESDRTGSQRRHSQRKIGRNFKTSRVKISCML